MLVCLELGGGAGKGSGTSHRAGTTTQVSAPAQGRGAEPGPGRTGGLSQYRAAGWNFPGKRKEEATSGCLDLQRRPDAWHQRDFPPAAALLWTSYLLAAASHSCGDSICK